MSNYSILYAKEAFRDIGLLPPKQVAKFKKILEEVISKKPKLGKRLKGDMQGYYSLRLSIKDRILYSTDDEKKIIYVRRVRTHYGD